MYLLIGFDKNTETDEFFTGNKVKVEHNELQQLKELLLKHTKYSKDNFI